MAHDAAHDAALSPLQQVAGDCSADKQAFPVPWGKAMMWIFLLCDTFIFTCFLTSYMNVRMSTHGRLAEPERSVRAAPVRAEHPAVPDRDHDHGPDHLQRHDGDGGELRLSARQAQDGRC